jgi:hypothetical protein
MLQISHWRRLLWPTALVVLSLALAFLAGGCHREVVAPGDPVAAVKGLAEALHDNDLVRYWRLTLPPALQKAVQARWKARLATAPAPTEQQEKDYARMMARLTAPDAEAKLYRSLDPKLKKLETEIGSQWPMMQTTAGIFIKGIIQANDKLSPAEKEHAKAVGIAVLDWAQPAVITDRARAKQAITVMTETARELDLPTLAQARALELIPALEKFDIALKGGKKLGLIYGVDVDAALANVDVKLVAASGDSATTEVSYPLLGRTVSFQMELLRRDGRWYSADAVRDAEADLVRPLPTAPAAVAP